MDGALLTETEGVAVRRIPGVTPRDALAGLGVFFALALLGVAIREVELFGALPRHHRYPLPVSAVWNGLALGMAPFVGVLWTYRSVRRIPAAPYGLHGRGPVGGRKTVLFLGLFAAVSALLFGDRGRGLEGAALSVFVAVVLAIGLEGQRRRRDWLGPDEWTDQRLDEMVVQVEVLVIGAVAAIAGVIVASTDPSVAADERLSFALVPMAFAMFAGWCGAVGAMSTTPAVNRVLSPPTLVSWIWILFWFATAVLAAWSDVAPTLVSVWAVAGGRMHHGRRGRRPTAGQSAAARQGDPRGRRSPGCRALRRPLTGLNVRCDWSTAGKVDGADRNRWTRDEVHAAAPDASSVSAASKLASGGSWSGEGCAARAVWGACKGSGKTPYAVAVDLDGPAYQCSCPSRKFPCKHALALLLRWTDGTVGAGEPPEDVASWLAKRAERSDAAAARAGGASDSATGAASGGSDADAAQPAVADPDAQRKRIEERAARVAGGIDDLERWLGDRIRGGLAPLLHDKSGIGAMARRMVDAQAPGLARRLEASANQVGGANDWTGRVLDDLALLHLLLRAYRLVAADPDADAAFTATVRQHVGFPVSEASVREREGISDTWLVGDRRDEPDGHLTRRTTWLHGERTGRAAMLLAFAPPGAPLDGTLVPGTTVPATLHFYPGAHEQRAVVGEAGAAARADAAPSGTISGALDHIAAAIAADPWLGRTAVWVDAVLREHEQRWMVVDELGDALRITTGGDGWELLVLGAGLRRPSLIEWSPDGWRLLAIADWAPAATPADLEATPW